MLRGGIAAGLILLTALSCGDGTTALPEPDPPRPTTVAVSPATVVLTALEQTAQLTAQVLDQRRQVIAGVPIIWGSGDASVATVDAAGVVTSRGNGEAIVTATAGGTSNTATVTVAQEASTVTVSPRTAQLNRGEAFRLAAEATDANGHAMADAEFAWSSSDTTVARVTDSGVVRAGEPGMATISAASGSASGTSEVTVAEPVGAVNVAARRDAVRRMTTPALPPGSPPPPPEPRRAP